MALDREIRLTKGYYLSYSTVEAIRAEAVRRGHGVSESEVASEILDAGIAALKAQREPAMATAE